MRNPIKIFNQEQVQLAVDNNNTIKGIANELGISDCYVYAILSRFGIIRPEKYKIISKIKIKNINFICQELSPEQKAHNDTFFEIMDELTQADEDKKPFIPIMEDFFGEKGNLFYKRELPQTTMTFEQFINR